MSDLFSKLPPKVQFPYQFICKCGKFANYGKEVNLQLAIKKDDLKYLGIWQCKECYENNAR